MVTFLGVIGAFASQRAYDKYKSIQERKKLKQNFKSELINCISLLSGKGNLIPTTMWISAINTGDLRLLPFNDKARLSSIYFEIENYNYEAKRVRDAAAIAHTPHGGGTLDASARKSWQYWELLSLNLKSNESSLKEKIDEVLTDKLWDK